MVEVVGVSMNPRAIAWVCVLLLLSSLVSGCVRDPTSCSGNSDCFRGEVCESGLCVEEEPMDECGGCREGTSCEPISKLCIPDGTLLNAAGEVE